MSRTLSLPQFFRYNGFLNTQSQPQLITNFIFSVPIDGVAPIRSLKVPVSLWKVFASKLKNINLWLYAHCQYYQPIGRYWKTRVFMYQCPTGTLTSFRRYLVRRQLESLGRTQVSFILYIQAASKSIKVNTLCLDFHKIGKTLSGMGSLELDSH